MAIKRRNKPFKFEITFCFPLLHVKVYVPLAPKELQLDAELQQYIDLIYKLFEANVVEPHVQLVAHPYPGPVLEIAYFFG